MICSKSLGELRMHVHNDLVLQSGVQHTRSVFWLQHLDYSCGICWTFDTQIREHRVRVNMTVVLGGFVHFDQVDLYSLIGQLRYQLQLGLQITMAKEPPKASPKKIERFRRSGLKILYFLKWRNKL